MAPNKKGSEFEAVDHDIYLKLLNCQGPIYLESFLRFKDVLVFHCPGIIMTLCRRVLVHRLQAG